MSPFSSTAHLHLPKGIPPTFTYPVHLCIYTTLTTYILSLITGNFSQVDRIWTFMPTMYSAYFALLPFWPTWPRSGSGGDSYNLLSMTLIPVTPGEVDRRYVSEVSARAALMFGLQFLWMLRLSYNTWRRGLFNFHEEDYRWIVFRRNMPKWVVHIFNLTFIAITQNILLFLLSVPTHNAVTQIHTHASPRSLITSDYALALLSVLTLAMEFTADNQQFAYQTFKHNDGVRDRSVEWPGAGIEYSKADRDRGFITKGLWAWSRHPNFFCEQTFWILQCLFPLLARYHNVPLSISSIPTLIFSSSTLVALTPCISLCTLFISSTIFTESISVKKYPLAYKAYQRRVAMFLPILTPIYALWTRFSGEGPLVDGLIWGEPGDGTDSDAAVADGAEQQGKLTNGEKKGKGKKVD